MRSLWASWEWDWATAGWALWLLEFAVLETLGIMANSSLDPLTAHLRPVFVSTPITWYLTLGLWMWLFTHFLVEPFGSFGGLVDFLARGS